MKILACHNFYQLLGGEDLVFQEETSLLEEYGDQVVRYTRHNDELPKMGKLSILRNTIWNRETQSDLEVLIRREKPDVMHCTNTFPIISPSAYSTARSMGVAVVQSLHNYRLICPKAQLLRNGAVCEDCLGRRIAWPGILHGCYKDSRVASLAVAAMIAAHNWKGTWQRDVDCFITPTAFTRQKFVDNGLPAEKIIAKPNFVNMDMVHKEPKEDYAVFVGRLSPEKGIQTLVDAWSQVQTRFHLKIIGEGPMTENVRSAAIRDPRIERLGQLPWEKTMDIISKATCLIMPSIWFESFGRCIIEAFATGTPVIVSRLGAMEELVQDGTTGLFASPGDAVELASKIAALLGDSEKCNKMGLAARRHYEERFSKQANYQMLIDIYQQAISACNSTRDTSNSNGKVRS